MKDAILAWFKQWRIKNKNPILFATVLALVYVAFLIGKLLGEGPPPGQWWMGEDNE